MSGAGTVVPSLIRTYVPVVVGSLAGWLVSLGIDLDANAQAGLIVGLTGLFTAAYYTLVRLLEKRFPWLSVLLGSSQMPAAYSPTGSPSVSVPGEDAQPRAPTNGV